MELLPFDILYFHLGTKYPHAYNLLTRSNKYWHGKLEPLGDELRKKWTRKVVAVFKDKHQKHLATLLPNGQYHGEYTVHDTRNNRRIELITYDNGVKHGKYEKNELRQIPGRYAVEHHFSSGSFVNGQLHGKWRVWNEVGGYEAWFTKGKLNGKEVIYQKNRRTIVQVTHYKDGLKHGIHQKFNKDGAKILECKYNNDVLDGWYTEYVHTVFSKSRKHIHAHYSKGLLDGEKVFFGPNGSIIKIETWVQGGLYKTEQGRTLRNNGKSSRGRK
uniref:MORN repeat-containing protein n=1 Tax=Clandestinovirus TaxID=2831644 RepID=A0A8F8KLE2_9VIRU|nr:MORN repeat-containing protein [Clandestinovirus]